MSTNTRRSAASERRPTNQAIELFQKGVKALGKREFERAREHFAELMSAFPGEREVVERARTYLAVCDRSLGKAPVFKPKTFDELLHHGVYLHNRGDYDGALKFLRQAAEIHPRNEHVLYCLAASAARAGDSAAALKSLRSAIAAGPESRSQARRDPDFESLRDDDDFQALLQPES